MTRQTVPLTNTDVPCCAAVTEAELSSADAENSAVVFAALSDPVRLRLFSIIAANGSSCSCDLEGPLQRSQPTISHHTKILADAGLITGEKRGRWMWWSVNSEKVAQVRRLLGET